MNVNLSEPPRLVSTRIAGEVMLLSSEPGATMRKWRELVAVYQMRLSDKMVVSASVISDYESGRGRAQEPSLCGDSCGPSSSLMKNEEADSSMNSQSLQVHPPTRSLTSANSQCLFVSSICAEQSKGKVSRAWTSMLRKSKATQSWMRKKLLRLSQTRVLPTVWSFDRACTCFHKHRKRHLADACRTSQQPQTPFGDLPRHNARRVLDTVGRV